MKERLIQFLACPACSGEIHLTETHVIEGIEILEGKLGCEKCDQQFPIARGVPRFADLKTLEGEQAATASKFGFEWKYFTQHDEKYGEQFLGWLAPVESSFFKNKLVLDGGCGKGRHMLTAHGWGALDVVGIDLSDAVDSAFAATRYAESLHVIQADICRLPLKQVFDYAYSVGVLDHIPEPLIGFKSLASKVRPGGHLSVWVYGEENNRWILKLVNPVRKRLTSRMNARTLLHFSKLPTAAVYIATKFVFGPLSKAPLGRRIVRRLFYSDYMVALSEFGWKEQHNIVFDHLVAPTAHYVNREQFEEWWNDIGARDTMIGWHNKNSWRGFGKVSGQ